MIDLRLLRSAPAEVRAALARRGDPGALELLDALQELDARRRTLTTALDALKAERNEAARADALLVKQHGKLPPETVAARRALGERITAAELEVREVEAALEAKALYVPNLPAGDVPDGDAAANRVVRSWGTPRPSGPDVRPHWEIGERLGLLDLPRGAKLPGSRAPSSSSCSTCTRVSTATWRWSRPSWCAARSCRAPDSCRNSRPMPTARPRMTCSSCRPRKSR